ncbi:MAG: YdcF family protein [Oscillospiraceae bacterium]|nr:YdcF family protein [Oscillospiraceae bacterium]
MSALWKKKWVKGLLALALAGLLSFCALLGAVLYGSYDHIEGKPSTMLILGCQVHPWGPSILLQDRLDEALDYLAGDPDMTVIVSGGQGPDEHTSEADCMRDYLISAGVEASRILVEDQSHNTVQNITYSAQLMQKYGIDMQQGVLMVSNGFHLTRGRMLWDRVTGAGEYLSTLAAPSSHVPSRLWMYIREPLALVKSYFFDR